MSAPRPRGPIVIDTDVFSADLVPGSRLAERYAPVITGRLAFISFQTVAEVRYGALRRGWGSAWRPPGTGTFELRASYPKQRGPLNADTTSCPLRWRAG